MKIEHVQILHTPSADSPFLVVVKPAGLPSAPLRAGEESVLTEAIRLFPEIENVHGKKDVEKGLVHRIDTETTGLVLIATTQESYDALIRAQQDNRFEKWYRAEVERIPDCARLLAGFPPVPKSALCESGNAKKEFTVTSAFRAFGVKGQQVRPVTESAGRAALKKGGTTQYTTEISFESETVALCHITRGFRHQVRSHLAWCGFPVKGDALYNPHARECSPDAHDMRFFATKISFPHPLTQVPQVFEM